MTLIESEHNTSKFKHTHTISQSKISKESEDEQVKSKDQQLKNNKKNKGKQGKKEEVSQIKIQGQNRDYRNNFRNTMVNEI